MFYDGSQTVRVVGGSVSFYENYTTTNVYVERVLGGSIGSLTISNDSDTDDIQVSFDGATLEAELNSEESITLNTKGISSVYIKGTAGGDTARLWGW